MLSSLIESTTLKVMLLFSRNQSGFLSAAAGVVVLTLFVGLVLLQKNYVQNTTIPSSPSPSPSVSEVKFTNTTKHMTSAPSSTPNPSPSTSSKPNTTQSSGLPTPPATPSSTSSPTPSPSPAGRYIKVLSPNGGENYKIGDTVNITWEYNQLAQCVIIYVLEDGTKSSLFIPVNPSKKSYPLVLLSDYLGMIDQVKVKVEMSCYDNDSNYAGDQSDHFFTITK